MPSDIKERMDFLAREIARHDRLYYVDAKPEIGDADYDRLYRELEALEASHPDLARPDSPTRRVGGAPLKEFAQARHDPPMMSLDKTHSREDLFDFDVFLHRQLPDSVWDYAVEPKIDGVAVSLIYLNGMFARAATRGNGEVGDDVTANVRTIRSLPLRIETEATLVEVRGEIYMSRAGFAELNRREEESGREGFANPRNAAAGSLKLLDPKEVVLRPLDILLYATGGLRGISFATHGEMTEQFIRWGFPVAPWRMLCVDMKAAVAAIDVLRELRHTFPFEIDGAVVKINNRNLYDRLGSTAKSPRWARAFKYEPERVETKIEAITIQVGRTGVLTPVAELTPVLLAGSTISRATLHNADEIARKDVRIGDTVWLVKAGDVIPAVESVNVEKRTGSERVFVMPAICPDCGGAVVRFEGEVAVRCVNPACPAQRAGRLEHFVSRGALDIRAVGGKVVEAFVQQGLVVDPLDLFELDFVRLAEFQLDGRKFGRNAATVAEAVEAARKLPLHRWLFAIGIPGIGVNAAEQVAAAHGTLTDLPESQMLRDVLRLDELYAEAQRVNPRSSSNPIRDEADRQARESRHLRICGEIGVIGESFVEAGLAVRKAGTTLPPEYRLAIKKETARAALDFFRSDYGKEFMVRLARLGINPVSDQRGPKGTGLSGLTFVLTGTLSEPRPVFAERIKSAGGAVADAVSKATDYLVVGENVGASKMEKARTFGVKIIDETELLQLLGKEKPERVLEDSADDDEPPSVPSGSYSQQMLF